MSKKALAAFLDAQELNSRNTFKASVRKFKKRDSGTGFLLSIFTEHLPATDFLTSGQDSYLSFFVKTHRDKKLATLT